MSLSIGAARESSHSSPTKASTSTSDRSRTCWDRHHWRCNTVISMGPFCGASWTNGDAPCSRHTTLSWPTACSNCVASSCGFVNSQCRPVRSIGANQSSACSMPDALRHGSPVVHQLYGIRVRTPWRVHGVAAVNDDWDVEFVEDDGETLARGASYVPEAQA